MVRGFDFSKELQDALDRKEMINNVFEPIEALEYINPYETEDND